MKNLPDKIYILPHEDYSDRRIFNAFTERESNTDVEYVRKDAFVKNVCEFLNNAGFYYHYDPIEDNEWYDGKQFIEDFKKYIEK